MLHEPDVNTEAPGSDLLLIRSNKLDLLERLADDLAHEIKNPLHSMVINLEVLKRRVARWGDDDQPDVLRYVGVLAAELERVSQRIELLLRLARPARGAEQATLDEMVGELLELVQLEGRRRRVEVRFEPSAASVRVHVPREPVRQVILDLALDALDCMQGGVLLLRTGQGEGRASLRLTGTDGAGEVVSLGDSPASGCAERLSVARTVAERIGGRVEATPRSAGGDDEGGLVFSLPAAG